MGQTRSAFLSGKPVEITDQMRSRLVEEMPETQWIENDELRQNVVDAWSAAIASSSFRSLAEIKPSGNYNTKPLKHGSQADHIRSVTRLAVKIAEEFADLLPNFSYNRDLLIAGALCHDIGKVWEFDPENIKRWQSNPRTTGMPSIRHPAYGVHICLSLELPEEVAHMAAAHSGEGELLTRSVENTILRWADVTFWRVAEAGDQFQDGDEWLSIIEPAQAPRPMPK